MIEEREFGRGHASVALTLTNFGIAYGSLAPRAAAISEGAGSGAVGNSVGPPTRRLLPRTFRRGRAL